MAGDDPRIYLLTWQIRMDIYREGKKNSLNGWGGRHPRDCIWFCEIVYHGVQMWFLVMERVVMKACLQSRRFWPESSLHFSDRLTFSLCSSLPTPNLGIQSIALLQLS